MAVSSKASTTWNGGLSSGHGRTTLASGNGAFDVTWKARSEGEEGATTPEELLAAAHASCFSMALSLELERNGTPPSELQVAAEVRFVAGTGVTQSILTVRGTVPDIDPAEFSRLAEAAKDGCPVSQALAGVDISLESATLAE